MDFVMSRASARDSTHVVADVVTHVFTHVGYHVFTHVGTHASTRDRFPPVALRPPRSALPGPSVETGRGLTVKPVACRAPIIRRLAWTPLLAGLFLLWTASGCSTGNRASVDVEGVDVEGESGADARQTHGTVPAQLRRPAPRDQGYIGSVACQPCHREIFARYQSHPMAHSFMRIGNESATATESAVGAKLTAARDSALETGAESTARSATESAAESTAIAATESAADAATSHFPEFAALPVAFRRGTARGYGVELRDGRLWHRESRGNEYSQSEPIAFAIGSGRRGRSYVLNRDGWLTMSPLSWYAAERRWDLSPEYAPESHPRFDRPVSDRCVQCHAGRVERASISPETPPATGDVVRYSPRVATELAIGCERCHGPGERHVAKHGGGLATIETAKRLTDRVTDRPSDDSICNPARLPSDRADDVCNQCHLSGATQVLRYGRTHGDFRPGDRLGDIWITLEDESRRPASGSTEAVQAVSHVWQMRASRCFEASGGELRCVSCHDPHGIPDERSRVAFFDGKCLACHSAEACEAPSRERSAPPADGSCIACHMPRLPASDVPHTTQTDHRIARRPAGGGSASARTARAARPDLVDVPPWEIQRARVLQVAQQAELERSPTLAIEVLNRLKPFESIIEGDADLLDSRAICRLLAGQRAEAIQDWERLLNLDPARLSALQSLLTVHMDMGETTRAASYAERSLALHPRQSDVLFRYSVLAERLGRFERAAEAIEAAWRLNPASAAIRQRRATLRTWTGEPPATSPSLHEKTR